MVFLILRIIESKKLISYATKVDLLTQKIDFITKYTNFKQILIQLHYLKSSTSEQTRTKSRSTDGCPL